MMSSRSRTSTAAPTGQRRRGAWRIKETPLARKQAHHRHHVLRKLLRRLLPRQQQEEDPRDGRRRTVAGDRHQTADPPASTVGAVIPRHDVSRKRDRRASVRGSYRSQSRHHHNRYRVSLCRLVPAARRPCGWSSGTEDPLSGARPIAGKPGSKAAFDGRPTRRATVNLVLRDLRRGPGDDKYVWMPFEVNDQFNGEW